MQEMILSFMNRTSSTAFRLSLPRYLLIYASLTVIPEALGETCEASPSDPTSPHACPGASLVWPRNALTDMRTYRPCLLRRRVSHVLRRIWDR